MREKIKTGISVFIIVILLPYVAAVFRTGGIREVETETPEVEKLVAEILPTQMSVTYEEEALKAQAVVIRTNLIRKSMELYGSGGASEAAEAVKEEDLETMGFSACTKEKAADTWGYEKAEEYLQKCLQAALDTKGEILLVNEKPADLPYHAVSSGKTRSGSVLGEEYVFLESVECPEDLGSSEYLKIQTLKDGFSEAPEILARDEAGYVLEVRTQGEIMAGEEFRTRFHLNSSCFTAKMTEEGLRITTKGYGHGLGMSLYEANCMALAGKKYQEILSYFYKNTECISYS